MSINSMISKMNADGVSAATLNRLQAMMDSFATPEAFFLATKADLLKAYRKMCPDAKRDLGARFFDAMAAATRYWKAPDETPPPDEPEIVERDPLDITLTAADVLLVAELMEKFDKPQVSVRWMLRQIELARGE